MYDKLWKNLFSKLFDLALHSLQPETKQSIIHTFTQILAESSNILDHSFLYHILKDVYMKIFEMMLGINLLNIDS